MNSVQLVGRLVRDPENRYAATSGMAVCRFTLAVYRRFAKEGEQSADFISCVAFGKTAEFIEKYFSKGQRIGLNGHIQTGSYTNKDGQKVYTTDVLVENCEFVEKKQDNPTPAAYMATNQGTPFDTEFTDSVDDSGLPFN